MNYDLSGHNFFTCERFNCRMLKIRCVQRQKPKHDSWGFGHTSDAKMFMNEGCAGCVQGQEIAKAVKMEGLNKDRAIMALNEQDVEQDVGVAQEHQEQPEVCAHCGQPPNDRGLVRNLCASCYDSWRKGYILPDGYEPFKAIIASRKRANRNPTKKIAKKPSSTIKVHGLGQDAPIVTNQAGGKQSSIPFHVSRCPVEAIIRMAGVFTAGAEKYGLRNWEKIPLQDNLDHALAHILAYLAGDRQDDHLGHGLARMAMAVWAEERSAK